MYLNIALQNCRKRGKLGIEAEEIIFSLTLPQFTSLAVPFDLNDDDDDACENDYHQTAATLLLTSQAIVKVEKSSYSSLRQ